jgi:hypothetical protein
MKILFLDIDGVLAPWDGEGRFVVRDEDLHPWSADADSRRSCLIRCGVMSFRSP